MSVFRASTTRGSSPLARGLPEYRIWDRECYRIIPARAGFTRFDGDLRQDAQDHPRSRGVYLWPDMIVRLALGSSPLARGLPRDAQDLGEGAGIIPARAGFT